MFETPVRGWRRGDPRSLGFDPAATVGRMTEGSAAAGRRLPRAVRNLTKTYGTGEARVVALDDVTLDLAAGEFTAVMGPSGSGKSTLMHCCAALDTADSGSVFDRRPGPDRAQGQGADPAAARRDRLRLPVLQPGADADRGGEHPAAAGDRRPQARPGVVRLGDRHRRARATGSTTSPTSSPAASSSGSRSPGRWSAGRRIVFADEPTGNLDSRSGAEVLELLRRSVDDHGQTVVMVTHDPVAAAYTDRVRVPRRRPGRRRAARPRPRAGARDHGPDDRRAGTA